MRAVFVLRIVLLVCVCAVGVDCARALPCTLAVVCPWPGTGNCTLVAVDTSLSCPLPAASGPITRVTINVLGQTAYVEGGRTRGWTGVGFCGVVDCVHVGGWEELMGGLDWEGWGNTCDGEHM